MGEEEMGGEGDEREVEGPRVMNPVSTEIITGPLTGTPGVSLPAPGLPWAYLILQDHTQCVRKFTENHPTMRQLPGVLPGIF